MNERAALVGEPRQQALDGVYRGTAKPGILRRLALFASGADRNLLRQVRIDEDSHAQLGSSVWLAACLGAVGAGVGLTSRAGHISWPSAIAAGLLVGLLVFSVDRLLVRMPLNPFRFSDAVLLALHSPVSEHRFHAALAALDQPSARSRASQIRAVATPFLVRLAISLCMSFIIANLLLFVLFAPEVNQRVAYLSAQTNQQLITETNATFDEREVRLKQQKAALAVGTGARVDRAQRALAAAAHRLLDVSSDLTTLHAALLAETNGTPRDFLLSTGAKLYTSNVPGSGSTARSIVSSIQNAEALKAASLAEVAHGQSELAIAKEAAKRNRAARSPRLAELDSQLATLEMQREAVLKSLGATSAVIPGILVRYDALVALEHDAIPETGKLDPPATCRSWGCRVVHVILPATPLGAWVTAFRALLLLIDLLPMVVKLHMSLRPRRPYDALRAAYEEIALADTLDLVHRELLTRRLKIDRRIASAASHDQEPESHGPALGADVYVGVPV